MSVNIEGAMKIQLYLGSFTGDNSMVSSGYKHRKVKSKREVYFNVKRVRVPHENRI